MGLRGCRIQVVSNRATGPESRGMLGVEEILSFTGGSELSEELFFEVEGLIFLSSHSSKSNKFGVIPKQDNW